MRTVHVSSILLVALAGLASAETEGHLGINDYTVNGLGSEEASCYDVSVPVSAFSTFRVEAINKDIPVFLFFSVNDCFPCFVPLGNSASLAPGTTCFFTSNNSLDLVSLDAWLLGETDSDGVYEAEIFVPGALFGKELATQALILDPSCGSIWFPPGMTTQALDLDF